MRYVTISVKIPRELKELMDKYGIKPSTVIRRALEEEVKKRILEEAENKAKELINKVSHISDEEIARIKREDRDGR
jgi:CO dehydrogenase nickel-insertion accessory protein CooC1